MIKLAKHSLVCECADCARMFPADRFEATWELPRPEGAPEGTRSVAATLPLGASRPALAFRVWVDAAGRLVGDWPGIPGTAGARVEVAPGPPERVVDTTDPVLQGFRAEVPLRRRLAERISARMLVALGLAEPGTADHIACARHGEALPALTCEHLAGADTPQDAVLVYGVDGDYPDLFCPPCLAKYAHGDLDVCLTTCSRCQQARIYQHRLVGRSTYGAADA